MKSTATIAVLAAVLGISVSPAFADWMQYNGQGLTSNVLVDADGYVADGKTLPAGQMEVNWGGEDYLGYCVDLNHYAGSDEATARPLSVLNNGDLIGYLFETYANDVTTGTQAAALQSAMWELLYETSGVFDLNMGTFNIANNLTVATAANTMLANLPTAYSPQTEMFVLDTDSKQDIVVGTGNPVPEPATLALLAVGGTWVLTRRKRRTA